MVHKNVDQIFSKCMVSQKQSEELCCKIIETLVFSKRFVKIIKSSSKITFSSVAAAYSLYGRAVWYATICVAWIVAIPLVCPNVPRVSRFASDSEFPPTAPSRNILESLFMGVNIVSSWNFILQFSRWRLPVNYDFHPLIRTEILLQSWVSSNRKLFLELLSQHSMLNADCFAFAISFSRPCHIF